MESIPTAICLWSGNGGKGQLLGFQKWRQGHEDIFWLLAGATCRGLRKKREDNLENDDLAHNVLRPWESKVMLRVRRTKHKEKDE